MAITLEKVTKRYEGTTIVESVSLEVQTGELFVLLGASGSGKSSILRLISGLLAPDEGAIRLGGRDVTMLPPQKRDVGFVFQNYSIFRHMTVAQNIEFGLRIRSVPASERAIRREELLDLVGLGGLGSRYWSQLSGGQLQRVALARALAYRPAVLLLDEPFGALDVKIRAQLRQNLKQIQKTLGVTTILVTHDQEEGFELGQRIGVIERGRLLEVGEPEDLYAHPRSLFAATFLGAGTILVGRCRGERVELGPLTLPIPPDVPHDEGDRVRVLFRPEQVRLSADPPPPSAAVLGRGELLEESFSGSFRRARLRLPALPGTRQLSPALPYGENALLIEASVPADGRPIPAQVWVALEHWHILRQPTPRLLVVDSGEASDPALAIAGPLVEALDGVATVVGIASGSSGQDELRETLGRRAREAGLDTAAVRARAGDPAEQLALEQSEAPYDFLLLGDTEPAAAVRKAPRGRPRRGARRGRHDADPPRPQSGPAAEEDPDLHRRRRAGKGGRPRRRLARAAPLCERHAAARLARGTHADAARARAPRPRHRDPAGARGEGPRDGASGGGCDRGNPRRARGGPARPRRRRRTGAGIARAVSPRRRRLGHAPGAAAVPLLGSGGAGGLVVIGACGYSSR